MSEYSSNGEGGRPFNSLAVDPELIADFVLESREHLSAIEGHLLVLEQDPENPEPIHSIFRGFHTIKGLAGFLDLDTIRDIAHEVETVLDEARNGNLKIGPGVADVILQSADFLDRSIVALDQKLKGQDVGVEGDERSLLALIRALLPGTQLAEEEPAPSAPAPRSIIPFPPQDAAVHLTPATPEEIRPDHVPGHDHDHDHASKRSEAASGARQTVATNARVVKVDTAKLDKLVELVGEMVIAQSLVRHDPALRVERNSGLARNLSQLSRIINDTHETSMSMRMVPIGHLFSKMQRVVRDLARKSHKRIQLVTFGDDTELDRRIVDELADPIMHMMRNSADHGIEEPEERLGAGKSEVATITLRAAHQSGQILIEIMDDGRGLNLEKIRKTAIKRGLIDEGAQLSESEIANLIMLPGFSTADQVTDISGRGVGMDVVKKQILQLRGRIEIQTWRGKGTNFALKLPLTLAIIDGLLVRVGAERYVIPIVSVRELLRPSANIISTIQGRGEVAIVRGETLPIVRLHRRFGVEPSSEDITDNLLVIAESEAARFCLMVDELIGKQEVVIKSLGESFRDLPGVAGGAILGDGKVGLILDMDGVFGGPRSDHFVQAS